MIVKIKKYFSLLLVLCTSLLFTSCPFILAVLDSLLTDETIEDLSSYEDEPDNAPYFYTLKDSDNSITLKGVKDKVILYANYNPTKTEIPQTSLRKIQSSQGLKELDSKNIFYYSGSFAGGASADRRSVAEIDDAEQILKISDANMHKCSSVLFEPLTFSGTQNAGVFRSASRDVKEDNEDKEVTIDKFTVGMSRKIYVDNDINIKQFVQKEAVLKAVKDPCLVWVVEDYYTDGTSEGSLINTDIAEKIAEKFVEHYKDEKQIFGDESEYLIKNNTVDTTEMKFTSETGNLINIVVYDIGNDYGKEDPCGVVGYFYSKDYFHKDSGSTEAIKYSNEGKYFYIDSAYCNFSGTEVDKNGNTISLFNGTNDVSETVITTLFHEFQHMINFNQKTVKNKLTVPTWYNEMLSMLAEDMMSTALGVKEDPAYARLPLFNAYYFFSGIDQYREQAYSIFSYSTAYAFGAWLSREYGGPEFVSAMSKNDSVGLDSIVSAIENNGTTVSKLQLQKKFIQACVFRDDNNFASGKGLPTLNKDAGGSYTLNNSGNSYTYEMPALNLFSKEYANKQSSDSSKYYSGPYLLGNGTVLSLSNGSTITYKNLCPHSFLIHVAGKAKDDTVTLDFSQQYAEGEQILIFVQDAFTNISNQ